VRLDQATDRLLGQLEPYQQLPNLLAKHPTVIDAIDTPTEATNSFLLNVALSTGTDDIYLLNVDGNVIASSNSGDPDSFVGASYTARPDVQAAMNGRLGFYHAVELADQTRDFFYSRGVIENRPPVRGVIVAKIDVSQLEFQWNIDGSVIGYFDENDVIFAANRPELALMRFPNAPKISSPRYPDDRIKPFFDVTETRRAGLTLWSTDTDVLPEQVLVLTRAIPQIDLSAMYMISTADAFGLARQQTMLVAALLSAIGLGLFLILANRRRLSDRLILEAQANSQLEARVAQRTEQLEQAQNDLVQAGKLAALGQMSAGISHELSQPLATIQILSENAKKLQDRKRFPEASENLTEISAQTVRISRIIKNLRAFARKDDIRVEPVALAPIVADALRMLNARLTDDDITVTCSDMTNLARVNGGQVRLQQVLINLITNSADAMRDSPQRAISIDAKSTKKTTTLILRDSGPGLSDPDKAFEPFYTTKEIGASKGLGLGLSISHGIIGSLGGQLTARNSEHGGAELRVKLTNSNEDPK
jgi:two-component system C4-dicarboxylate transport sensor histidine kinase DctB